MREDDDQTIPLICGCSSQSVSPCEIPSPNMSNGDENQTSCPSLPKSSAKDEVSPDSSQEPPARLASPSAIRAFRASLHGDLLPNVNDFPNNIKKPPAGVKKEAVSYGDDPFLYTSTGAVKKPMLRPVKKPKLYSAQAADAEDPYALYVKNESNKSGERPSDPSQAAQYDVFRTTFSSLKDRAACSLAAFNLNKPRVKWRLLPVSRAKIKATRSPNSLPPVGVDPRSAASSRSMDKSTQELSSSGQTENVECGISGNLNSKNFRKVPVRCMSETASAIARPRLLLRPHCRRLSYKPNLMLNWRTQCEWNKQSELDPMEKELIMKNVIPKWGSANPNRAVFPFGKVEGIFWPVVQPHDAIDLNDEDQITSADTKNQLVCLSEMTFASRRQLLCGRDDQFHYKRYMEAAENENWQGGRFEHRIGYQRVFATQTIQEARQKDQEMQQKEAAWMQRLVELNTTNLSQSSEDSSHYQKAFQPNSLDMTRHIDFNLSDEYSRARDVASTKPEHFHLCKGRRPPLKVPRQWLEVDIDDYMPVSQRKDYLCSYINFRNTLAFEHEPMAGDSSRPDEMEQYHLSAIKAIFIHQSGHKAMGMKSSLPNDIQAKANKRLEDVSREVASESVSLSTLNKLCELQNWEERYWTIIWDNLAASYKHAAPVSQLELDTFIDRAFENAANVYQRHEYCQRFWYAVDKVVAL
ncbi:hypothetical protein Q1695_001973 [Nippostrongylus brasiliensis]|nr:hypothetical protein Q1695_001973 [Nippostrongylus brasiliensis]